MGRALKDNDFPQELIQIIPSADREDAVRLMQLRRYIDVLIPRGGKNLIESVGENSKGNGYFVLFDDDDRIVHTNGYQMYVINLSNKEIEVSGGIYYINKQILFSSTKNIIIGRGVEHITKLTYDSSTNISIDESNKETIYPNPTKDSIFLNYDCDNLDYSWELYNLKGELLNSTQKNIQFDNSQPQKISPLIPPSAVGDRITVAGRMRATAQIRPARYPGPDAR